MESIKYEDLPVIWQREKALDWLEVNEAVVEEIAMEVGTCQQIN